MVTVNYRRSNKCNKISYTHCLMANTMKIRLQKQSLRDRDKIYIIIIVWSHDSDQEILRFTKTL